MCHAQEDGLHTLVPQISRMLCMESWGAPTSRVRQPMPLARMGPMVDPHSMSFRMLNSWVGMPRLCASSLHTPGKYHHNGLLNGRMVI